MPVCTGAKNLAPPGFDLRAIQSVASRYTDYAISDHVIIIIIIIIIIITLFYYNCYCCY